jgi:ABC-type bacteriocin/lantibiotic exporter with double-glycine peptidase domain
MKGVIDGLVEEEDPGQVILNVTGSLLALRLISIWLRYQMFDSWATGKRREYHRQLLLQYLLEEDFLLVVDIAEPAVRCAAIEQCVDALDIVGEAVEIVVLGLYYAAFIVIYDWRLFLMVGASLPFDITIRRLYADVQRKSIKSMQLTNVAMNSTSCMTFQKINLVRNCERVNYELERYDRLYLSAIQVERMRLLRYAMWGNVFVTVLREVSDCGALLMLVGWVLDGRLTVGDFVLLVMYGGEFRSKCVSLGEQYAQYVAWKALMPPAAALKETNKTEKIEKKRIITETAIRVPKAFFIEARNKVMVPEMYIPMGSHCLVVGPNGCGKSTFFNDVLSRRLDPGPFLWFGPDVGQIHFVSAGLWLEARSVRENILYACTSDIVRLPTALLDMMDLGDLDLDIMPGRLSAGQLQKCMLIRASLSEKPIIILDEPTGAMTKQHERLFFEQWKRELFGSGRTLIVIAHLDHTPADFDMRVEFSNPSALE